MVVCVSNEVNKAVCKVVHLGQDNPRYVYRLEETFEEYDLVILIDEKFYVSQQCLLAVGRPTIYWTASEKIWQQGKRPDCLFFHCPHEALSGVLHPGLG